MTLFDIAVDIFVVAFVVSVDLGVVVVNWLPNAVWLDGMGCVGLVSTK